jgi:hypothetical protein
MIIIKKYNFKNTNIYICTVASNKFWSSRSFFDAIENAPL